MHSDNESSPSVATSQHSKLKRFVIILIIGTAIIYCFSYLAVNIWDVFSTVPALFGFVVNNFLPPDFFKFSNNASQIIDTILFAIVGTYLSAFLAFFFGLLMSEKMNPFVPLRLAVRFLMTFFRNIPVLIWASLLVFAFGIGNIIGLLALILATLGFLARSYSDSISEIAGDKLEALKASGAGYLQILFHGLMPEFIPAWVNWTLFSLEINIRASAILGMVGAGGVGILIQTNLNLFKYKEACGLIIILVAMVLLTEFTVNFIRSKIKL